MTEKDIAEENNMPKAILAGLRTDQSERAFEAAMTELERLAVSCGIKPLVWITQNADTPVQATYIGSGKAEEIKQAIAYWDADMVIFDQTLSPMQFRNLNKLFEKEVIDRTGLILRIFSEQARTRQSRLQVEYAQLQYTLPRLAGMWTHFGRQKGASGSKSNKGIGETQIELDRRYIEHRMTELSKQLKIIEKERNTQREKRLSAGLARIALVGYTNAGKSTLMNSFLDMNSEESADKKVLQKDKFFATLDTTVRKINIKGHRQFLLSDTVGFISELPHSLIKAFRSTLDEVKYADLLLEVIDVSDPEYKSNMDVTEKTLNEIGAGGIPVLYVYNKADLADEDIKNRIPFVKEDCIYMSAENKTGMEELVSLMEKMLEKEYVECRMLIPYSKGDVLSRLERTAKIDSTEYTPEGTNIYVKCSRADFDRYAAYVTADEISSARYSRKMEEI